MSEAEEAWSDESAEEDRGGRRGRGGRGRGRGGMRGPGRPRIVAGSVGAAISSGSSPWVGPLMPIPARKINYHRASQPVLLRQQCMTHAINGNYEHERKMMLNAADFVPSASYSGAQNFSTNGSIKTVENMVWIPIPKSMLSNNPETLVDFKVTTPDEMLMATAISFLLMSVSTVHLSTTKEQLNRGSSLSPGMFVANDGTTQPRAEAFVHSVFAPDADHPDGWMELVGSLPRDPGPGESTDAVSKPDVFLLNELAHPSRHVGYLVQVVYHDPTLHPNVQFAHTILNNRMLKMVDDRTASEGKIDALLFRTNIAFTRKDLHIDAAPGPKPPSLSDAVVEDAKRKPPTDAKSESNNSGSEAEEVADEDDIDEEKEAEEAAKMLPSVVEAARKRKEAPAETEEGKRLAERLSRILGGEGKVSSKAPAIEDAAFERNRKSNTSTATTAAPAPDDSSDGGSFDPSKPDEEDTDMKDASEAFSSDGESKSNEGTDDQDMKDVHPKVSGQTNHSDSADKEGEDEVDEPSEAEPDGGMTLDEIVAQTEKETGGPLDSEEERELREMEEERKNKRPRRKAATKSTAEEDLDAEERAIREKAANLSKSQKERTNSSIYSRVSNPFAIENNLDIPECKDQYDKELSIIKDMGAAYRTHEAARYRVAMFHRESIPALFGRSVLDPKLLSCCVMDPILRAAGSPLALQHRDGLYDKASNLGVEAHKYWMLDPSCPLHFSHFCSFAVARQILLRSFPERIGTVSNAESPQFDYFSYAGTPDDPFLRIPFPWLATSYDCKDLDPEALLAYKPPGALSAVDAILDQVQADEDRDKVRRASANAALAKLYEHPKAVSIAEQHAADSSAAQSPGKADSSAAAAAGGGRAENKIPHYSTATEFRIALSNLEKERAIEAAKLAAKEDKKKATTTEPSPKKSPRSKSRSEVQYDNDHDEMLKNLERLSGADPRTFASDAGISGAARERARFGSHAVLHGTRTKSVGSQLASRKSGKNSGAPSEQETSERKRIRVQSENDQLAWLEQAFRRTDNDTDRGLIGKALEKLRSLDGAQKTAALTELANPGEKSLYTGVAECCRRVLTRAAGKSNSAESGGTSNEIQGVSVHHTNEGAAALIASHGEGIHKANAQLSEYRVEDPIDRLAQQRATKYERIVGCSLKLPMRSNIESMRKWLNAQCPGWLNQPPATTCTKAQAAECNIPLADYQVLVSMTYDREERLRHEWLADSLSVFRGESGTEVCAALSLTNEELGDSLRGILMWLNSRPENRVMVVPVMTFDPTLTPLATGFIYDLTDTAKCRAVNEHFAPRMMRCLWNERLTMLRTVNERMPDILVLHGPPGCGKSLLFNLIKDASPPNCTLANHWRSKLALMTPNGKGITRTLNLNHEAAAVWADGTKTDPNTREAANMVKSMTTEQAIDYQRNKENTKTGQRELEKVHLVYHHNAIMGTNHYTAQKDIRDRSRYGTSMYSVSAVTGDAGTDKADNPSTDSEKQRAAEAWRNQRWDEVAVIAIVEAMIACKALPEVSTKVFESMANRGDHYLSSWLGEITTSRRPYHRGGNEARQLCLERAHHVLFRSEASPYLNTTYTLDEKTKKQIPHISADRAKEFQARDLTTLLPTMLCVGYGEAIPAYYSLLTCELLPDDEWKILNIVAAMVGFTDDYFGTCYHRFGIKLPDVLGRANQRRPDDSAEITLKRDTCSFLRDYYDNFENPIRTMAVENQLARVKKGGTRKGAPRPQFVTSRTLARILSGMPEPTDLGLSKEKLEEHMRENGPEVNPTLLYTEFTSMDELVNEVVSNCQGIVSGINKDVVMTLLKHLQERNYIKAPIHRAEFANKLTAAGLGFDATLVSGSTPNNATEVIPPLSSNSENQLSIPWRPVPILKIGMDTYTKKVFIVVSTYALMVKWPELTYMALTEHEGPHTRISRCVLPVGYTDAPLFMHVWTTRPNKFGTSAAQGGAKYRSMSDAAAERILVPVILPGDHRGREKSRVIIDSEHQRSKQLYDMSAYDEKLKGDKSGKTNPMSTMDLEMTEFVRFLASTHWVPSEGVDQAPAHVQDILTRYAFIAPTLQYAPGNVEKHIDYLRRYCPELGGSIDGVNKTAPKSYPEADVTETILRNDEAAAREEFDANPDAPIDSVKWSTYMQQLFPKEMNDSPSAKAAKNILEEVKAIEDLRRTKPNVKHHERHPAAMQSFLTWKRSYDRIQDRINSDKRKEVLAANCLKKIGEKALSEDSAYDSVYDYLVATSPGPATVIQLKNGVNVVVNTSAPQATDEESIGEKKRKQQPQQPSLVPATPEAENESDAFQRLRLLSEGMTGARLQAEGRSHRAQMLSMMRLAKKKKKESGSSSPATVASVSGSASDISDISSPIRPPAPTPKRRRRNEEIQD